MHSSPVGKVAKRCGRVSDLGDFCSGWQLVPDYSMMLCQPTILSEGSTEDGKRRNDGGGMPEKMSTWKSGNFIVILVQSV